MWPRLRLTSEELLTNSKYYNPDNVKQAPVLRRFYAGELNITSTLRQDQETFQISRRSRIFALTAIGDIQQIEVQLSDIAGEQYTPDYISLNNLIIGSIADPRSLEFFNANFAGVNTGYVYGKVFAISLAPLVFEPNIVQKPNQTMTINARPVNPLSNDNLHVDLTFHVWEFPNMSGGL